MITNILIYLLCLLFVIHLFKEELKLIFTLIFAIILVGFLFLLEFLIDIILFIIGWVVAGLEKLLPDIDEEDGKD